MVQLAKALMGMSMEGSYEAGVMKKVSLRTQYTVVEGGLELTPYIISTTKIHTESIQELSHYHKQIFSSVLS